jgi:hypothetical protein
MISFNAVAKVTAASVIERGSTISEGTRSYGLVDVGWAGWTSIGRIALRRQTKYGHPWE